MPRPSRRLMLNVHCPVKASTLGDHLHASLVAGVAVDSAIDADVWWLPAASEAHDVAAALAAAEAGAVVISREPALLGLAEVKVVFGACTFPPTSELLRPLQSLLARLQSALPAQHQLLHGSAEVLATPDPSAEPIASGPEGACCALVPRGKGALLLLGAFPDPGGAGFRVDDHLPLRSAVSQLLVDEVLAWAFRRKHGVVVRKLIGPHGAPMMAWQAHFEELGGLLNRGIDAFVGRAANSRQVATFSLIRKMFRWGSRTPGLLAFSGSPPVAQPDGPGFFSGSWVRQVDGSELGFAADPRLVQYYQPTPGQGRTYPAPMLDGRLALGVPSGRIEIYQPRLVNGRLALEPQGPLKLADGTVLELPGASPTFFAPASGPQLLVVADDTGALHCFEGTAWGWSFKQKHQLECRVSPRLVDWSGKGSIDLLLGMDAGRLELVEEFATRGIEGRTKLLETASPRLTPWAAGHRRVWFGDAHGRLFTWTPGTEPTLLPSADPSILGSKSPYVQQDSVPVVLEMEGHQFLLVGGSVVGAPFPITESPTREVVQRSLARIAPAGVTFAAHLAFAPELPLAEVASELERHRESFHQLGLAFEGADQHCWWVPKQNLSSVFLLQRTSGLCFNFGWQPPRSTASPDGDGDFCLSFPFLFRHEGRALDFVLHNPQVPGRWPASQALMTELGLPVVFFLHPEHRVSGAAGNELDGWIATIEAQRRKSRAVFVSTKQMAQATAVALASRVMIARDAAGLVHLDVDRCAVPAWAAAYAPTLAVRIEGAGNDTDAELAFEREGQLVVTLGGRVKVGAGMRSSRSHGVRGANGPIAVGPRNVEFSEGGFQELLVDEAVLVEWPGAHRRELGEGLVAYTRFGAPGGASIAAASARPKTSWADAPRFRDRWVVEEAFKGRAPRRGFFVEVGASDGLNSSAALSLERDLGWDGIAVEPNDQMFARLRQNRRCSIENACIGERTGTTEFIEASWYGRIREHVLDEMPDGDHLKNPFFQKDLDGSEAKVTKKKVLSLDDLLQQHRAPRRIDFMSINAEFSEWWIFRSFRFDKWEIAALCMRSKFEHGGLIYDSKFAPELRKHLCNFGYLYDRERSRNVEHDFFIHPDLVAAPFADAVAGRATAQLSPTRVIQRAARRLHRFRTR